ncbi:MAG TPA: hypothetical protein VHT91_12075 [Kofleriaceae bacterium]|jgi:hypothetical protein|nr:hypothetical protein [Kofleriaceae bacterium]
MTWVVSKLIDFIDERLNHMLEAPSMWGSSESVELQILQLLEIRSLVLGAPDAQSHWHQVQIDYERFIAAHFPGAPPTTLTVLLEQEPIKLIPLLAQFVAEQRRVQSSDDSVRNRNAWEVAMIESIMAKMRATVENERERSENYHFRPVKVTDKAA